MAVVRLKGLNRVAVTLAGGRRVVYWYAWKGGPRLEGEPGSPEFIAAFNKAVADRKAAPLKSDNLAGLTRRFRASPEFAAFAETTRRQWRRWLDRIEADAGPLDIGGLTFTLLDDRRVRADLLDWRDQFAASPRNADYAWQVLSRVLSYGVDRGVLTRNLCAGVGHLYAANRPDQIWTDDEQARYRSAAPSPEVGFIVPLACLTGLRREDLCRLADSHVGEAAIVMPTGKSRGRKVARIPQLTKAKALIAEIRAQRDRRHAELCALAARKKRRPPPKPLTLLSNTRGKPWTANGLEHMVIETKAKAGVDKHLHDARGTFATYLRKGGLTASQIADILAWEEERVERLLATYVDIDDVVKHIINRLAANETSPNAPK